jgi:hypothetical protein
VIESAEQFVWLRRSDLKEEYDRATNEEAPLEVWLQVIEDYPDMRGWVAHNKTVPDEVLRRLAEDEDAAVRLRVAMKRHLPDDVVARLAEDPDDGVRQAIARRG